MSGCGQGEPDQEENMGWGLAGFPTRQVVGIRRELSCLLIQFGQKRDVAEVG
jgi:hypothetical protein